MTKRLRLEDSHIRRMQAIRAVFIIWTSMYAGIFLTVLFCEWKNTEYLDFFNSLNPISSTLFVFVQTIFIPIIFLIIFYYRIKIIHKIIESFEYSQIYNLIKKINYAQNLILILFIFMMVNPIDYENKLFIESLVFSVIFLAAPAILIFNNPLTKNGIYLIQYAELYKNFDDFIERQKWLRLICRDIEIVFKRSSIWLNQNLLLFRINIELNKEHKILDFLKNTEKWFLSDIKNDDLLTHVNELIPESEIKIYEPKTINEKAQQIPLEYIKITMGVVIFIILMTINPEAFFDLLKKIGEKFL